MPDLSRNVVALRAEVRNGRESKVALSALVRMRLAWYMAEETMKVHDRIEVLTDLFLGALYADRAFDATEQRVLRQMLCDLIGRSELPRELQAHIERFSPERFDLHAAACEFLRDPPMRTRRLLELVAQLSGANGEFDLEKDEYLHRLARALAVPPVEYDDIVLDYEIVEAF